MCNYADTKLTKKQIRDALGISKGMSEMDFVIGSTFANGFAHDPAAIITDELRDEVSIGTWGISAPWIDPDDKKALLPLNARLDTIDKKPTFKNNIDNRCVILVHGFYEWQRLDQYGQPDPKGKIKVKNKIFTKESDVFSMGCIYYIDKNGQLTFTICTTEANELMAEIHNAKPEDPRMPVVLKPGDEKLWLKGGDIQDFAFANYKPNLYAVNQEPEKIPQTLF